MEVNTVTQSNAAGQPTGRGIGEMTGEDFFKVLITQLQQQDPLKPMGSDQMLNQMATIRELESSTKLTRVLEDLAGTTRIDQAATVIGRFVQGGGKDYEAVSGIVTGVRVENGKIILELDNGQRLPLEAVTYVSASQDGPAETGGDGAPETGTQDGTSAI